MASGAWSSEPSQPARRASSFAVKAVLGLLAVPFALLCFLLSRSKLVETQAWPVLREVALRLRTDAEAGRLYRANPALARRYPNEEVFLDRVRAYRAQFANLSELRPPADRYECFAGPNGFQASVQGSGGSWALLEVRQNFLLEKVAGEGLLRLEFSPTKEPNDKERRALRKAKAESDWRSYREICGMLASEAGTRMLWERSPGLRRSFPEQEALLAFGTAVRPRLHTLPESSGLSKVRLSRQVQRGGEGERVRLGYPFPAGTLTAVWSDGQLTGLEFTPS